jgi:hypothetical protein
MFKFSLKIFTLACLFSSSAFSQCQDTIKDVPIITKLATSSTYANIRGSADSLKVLSKELMLTALSGADSATPPEGLCPSSCKVNPKPEIIFSSTPNKYLTDYDDQKVCQELKQKTLVAPIEFKNKVFKNLDDLNSYYADLTRGSGEDGKALYKICHSSCSPSYKSMINKSDSAYKMDSVIVCNEARDKDEGMYSLSSSYRWSCSPI